MIHGGRDRRTSLHDVRALVPSAIQELSWHQVIAGCVIIEGERTPPYHWMAVATCDSLHSHVNCTLICPLLNVIERLRSEFHKLGSLCRCQATLAGALLSTRLCRACTVCVAHFQALPATKHPIPDRLVRCEACQHSCEFFDAAVPILRKPNQACTQCPPSLIEVGQWTPAGTVYRLDYLHRVEWIS